MGPCEGGDGLVHPGGRLPQSTPLPEKGARVLDAGALGEITFARVNMQERWLLKVRAKGRPTAG
eukprot:1947029-Pyramimonas_sp.AAC.1